MAVIIVTHSDNLCSIVCGSDPSPLAMKWS